MFFYFRYRDCLRGFIADSLFYGLDNWQIMYRSGFHFVHQHWRYVICCLNLGYVSFRHLFSFPCGLRMFVFIFA
uniref:Uncharacterized protein n=1 Tax=Pararge aegeria TaxID=116150 RepID=S4PUC3_9NEOP